MHTCLGSITDGVCGVAVNAPRPSKNALGTWGKLVTRTVHHFTIELDQPTISIPLTLSSSIAKKNYNSTVFHTQVIWKASRSNTLMQLYETPRRLIPHGVNFVNTIITINLTNERAAEPSPHFSVYPPRSTS